MATPLLLYLFNEGSGTTAGDTSSGTAANVTITPGGSGAWDATLGANKVGYDFAGTGTGVTGSLSGTKVQTALAGATKLTLELVFDSAASTSTYDEFLKVTDGSSTGLIGATVNHSQGGLIFSAAEGAFPNDCLLKYAIPTTGVIVLHVVLDSTQAIAADRVKVYVAGSGVTPTIFDQLGLNAAVDAGFNWSTSTLELGTAGASPRKLYYAALYAAALTPTEVATNATALASNNDANPNSAAAATFVPFRRQAPQVAPDDQLTPPRRVFRVPPPAAVVSTFVPYRRQPPQRPDEQQFIFMGVRSATIQSGTATPDSPPFGWPRRILSLFRQTEDDAPRLRRPTVTASGLPPVIPDNPPIGWPRRIISLATWPEDEARPQQRRFVPISAPVVITDSPPWGWPRRLAGIRAAYDVVLDDGARRRSRIAAAIAPPPIIPPYEPGPLTVAPVDVVLTIWEATV